jgi:hypothetical protein
MGNSNNSNNGTNTNNQNASGQAFVKTERPFYYSGEVVQGHVYLNILQHMQCNSVYLDLKGEMKSWWQETT